MDLASKGDDALAQSQASLAIQYYTRALLELPRAPNYYVQRSTAYSRLKPEDGGPSSHAALHDAEIAVTLAVERGKRELILAAQFRRAVSLFQLERYGDAFYLFQMLNEKLNAKEESVDRSTQVQNAMAASGSSSKLRLEVQVPVWVAKVNKKIDELAEGDEKRAVSISEYPKTSPLTKKELEAELNGETKAPGQKEWETVAPAQTSTPSESSHPPSSSKASAVPDKIRHEWYQSQESVVVTLYAKGVPKDHVESELKDESVSASLCRLSVSKGSILIAGCSYHCSSLSPRAPTTTLPSNRSMHLSSHPLPKSPSWAPRSKLRCKNRPQVRNGRPLKDQLTLLNSPIVPPHQQRQPVAHLHIRPRLVMGQRTGTKSPRL